MTSSCVLFNASSPCRQPKQRNLWSHFCEWLFFFHSLLCNQATNPPLPVYVVMGMALWYKFSFVCVWIENVLWNGAEMLVWTEILFVSVKKLLICELHVFHMGIFVVFRNSLFARESWQSHLIFTWVLAKLIAIFLCFYQLKQVCGSHWSMYVADVMDFMMPKGFWLKLPKARSLNCFSKCELFSKNNQNSVFFIKLYSFHCGKTPEVACKL